MRCVKTVIINGQNHKGSTYHIGKIFADMVSTQEDITEIFLPRDLDGFCTGCYACIEDEKKCPLYQKKNKIEVAMQKADLLIFTTPTYCMECSAPMKAFIDLFYQYWIPHRPRGWFFKKKAVVFSTAAGTGTRKAIAPIKRTLSYWGVPYIKSYGISVQASKWDEVSEKKKQKIKRDMSRLAKKVMMQRIGKPSLYIRFMFRLMGTVKKKAREGSYDYSEARYWQENGWLNGSVPWKK